MSKVPMWQDPDESPLVRELLQSGRALRAYDYDVEAGLAKHLALIDAGAPLPDWAEPLVAKTTATGVVGASGVSGLVLTSMAVGVIGAVAGIYVAMTQPEVRPQQPSSQGEVTPSADAADPKTIQGQDVDGDSEVEVQAQWERVHRRRSARRPANQAPAGQGRRRAAPAPIERSAPMSDGQDRVVELADPPRLTSKTDGVPAAVVVASEAARKAAPARSRRNAAKAAAKVPPAQEPRLVEAEPRLAVAPASADEAVAPASADEVVVDDMRFEREMRMLKVAQETLQTDPKRALRLAEAGEKEFPGSLFTQERQYLLIAALAKLGRIDDARKRATVYLRTYPTGPFSDRVRVALETE